MFKPDMIKAIAEGRKTMTRRVIKTPEKYDNIRGCDFCARYQGGETIYIKEAWASDCTCENPKCNGVIYKLGYSGVITPAKWRSPMFMPTKYARYFILIKDVWVERLQEITIDDCLAEGVSSRSEYAKLWDKINPPNYSWSDNPWVWVYSFKREEV